MNRITGIMIMVFIVLASSAWTGCAPDSQILLRATESVAPLRTEPLELRVGINVFTVSENTSNKFTTDSTFSDLEFKRPLGLQVAEVFVTRLNNSGIFKKVVLLRGRKSDKPVDLVISGHVNKSEWRDTGTFWNTVLLSGVTLEIYPLLGGAVSWPEALADIKVSVSRRAGKFLKEFSASAKKAESLSIYGLSRATPAAQLSDAFNSAFDKVIGEIDNCADLWKLPPPPLITIIHPKESATPYRTELLSAEIKARGDSVLAGFEILKNNHKYESGTFTGKTAKISRDIKLKPGKKTTITLRVFNDLGISSRKTVELSYKPPSAKMPSRWVLFVAPEAKTGEAAKLSMEFTSLFKDLRGKSGFSKNRTRVLCGAKATRENVRAAVSGFLTHASKKEEILFFFIGKGASLGRFVSLNYLGCSDEGLDKITDGMLSLEMLAKIMDFNLPNETKVCMVFLFTGTPGVGKPIDMPTAANVLSMGEKWTTIMGVDKGTTTAQWTGNLIESFSSIADVNRDGVLEFSEFLEHLKSSAAKGTKFRKSGGSFEEARFRVIEKVRTK